MTPLALESDSGRELIWIAGSVVVSLVLHVVLAVSVSRIPVPERAEPEWVEMAIQEVAPEPVPEPEPAPEPEPEPEPEPPPKPEVVEYEQPAEPPPEQPPPPDPRPQPRPVLGLNNDSFLQGSGGGDVRAGNTQRTKQTSETMALEEATETIVPYASVTVPPKVRFKGVIEVPDSIREAGIEGRVEVTLTVDAEGRVTDVAVTESLHPDADAACVAAVSKSRWKAGSKDGVAVITRGVPYTCRFEMNPG